MNDQTDTDDTAGLDVILEELARPEPVDARRDALLAVRDVAACIFAMALACAVIWILYVAWGKA